jgi:hypothetical protein
MAETAEDRPMNETRTLSRETQSPTGEGIIPRKSLEPLSKRRPEFGLRLAELMSQDRSLSFARLTSMGRQDRPLHRPLSRRSSGERLPSANRSK